MDGILFQRFLCRSGTEFPLATSRPVAVPASVVGQGGQGACTEATRREEGFGSAVYENEDVGEAIGYKSTKSGKAATDTGTGTRQSEEKGSVRLGHDKNTGSGTRVCISAA